MNLLVNYSKWAENVKNKYPGDDPGDKAQPGRWNDNNGNIAFAAMSIILWIFILSAIPIILLHPKVVIMPIWAFILMINIPFIILFEIIGICMISAVKENRISLRAWHLQPLVYKEYMAGFFMYPPYILIHNLSIKLIALGDEKRSNVWAENHPMAPQIAMAKKILNDLKGQPNIEEVRVVSDKAREILSRAQSFTTHQRNDEARIAATKIMAELGELGAQVAIIYSAHEDLMKEYHLPELQKAFGEGANEVLNQRNRELNK